LRAQIIRSSQREFICRKVDDGTIVQAKALGNLLRGSDSIVVGDYVVLSLENDEFFIKEVEKRSSEIFRMIVRERKRKVTAANCDLLVILSSVSKPAFKRGILDRFLIRAEQWGIEICVVFNKMDEYDPSKFDLAFEAKRLEYLGVKSFEISAKFADYKAKYLDSDIDDLRKLLKGRLSVFLGQSGVGKSKSISFLSNGRVDLKTKKVGKEGKGSHTTTWSEIINCGDFNLIDSPGIRSLSLEDIEADELLGYFPDLCKFVPKCKFNNCSHTREGEGCGFFADGNFESPLEKEIILSRLKSYLKVYEEVSETPTWKK
jgi:ribosome biogenesis GTPase